MSTRILKIVLLSAILGSRLFALQDPTGDVLYGEEFAGTSCGLLDGIGGPALHSIIDARTGYLTSDLKGNFYVLDYENSRVWWIDTARTVRCIAGSGKRGFQDGPADQARFNFGDDEYADAQIHADTCGNVYVSDFHNKRLRMIYPESDGTWWVTTLSGGGSKAPKLGVWTQADSILEGCAQNFGISLDGKMAFYSNNTGLTKLELNGKHASSNRAILLRSNVEAKKMPQYTCGISSWKSKAYLTADSCFYWMPGDPANIIRYDLKTDSMENYVGSCTHNAGYDGYRLSAGFHTVHVVAAPSGRVMFTGGPGDENSIRRIYQDTVKHLMTDGKIQRCSGCNGWGNAPLHVDQGGYLYYSSPGNFCIYRMRFTDTDTLNLPVRLETNPGLSSPLAEVSITPNPASQNIIIRIDSFKKLNGVFKIFDISGKKVFERSLGGEKRTILNWNTRSLNGKLLPSGCYLGKLVFSNGKAIQSKFLIFR